MIFLSNWFIIKILKLASTLSLAFCLIFICMFQSFGIGKDKNHENLLEKDFSLTHIDYLSDEVVDKGIEIPIESKTNCFDYLLSCGYPKEFLEMVTDSTLKNIVSLISNNEVSEVVYKAEHHPENSNIIIETIVAKLKDKHTGNVVGESVCIYWKWSDKTPLIREEDLISVSWNKELFVYDDESFYAEDYCKDNPTDIWSVSNSYTKLSRTSLNSVSHWSVLKTNKNVIGGSMMFNLLAISPIDTVNYNNNLKVEYTHQHKLLNVIIIFLAIFSIVVLIITLKIRTQRKNKYFFK